MLNQVQRDLLKLSNPRKAQVLSGFFKTGKGQYGEGDVFLGISVPDQRKVAIKHKNLSLEQIQNLLLSKIHEYRLTALLILVQKYNKSDNKTRKKIFDFYIRNIKNINNWDLVDLSAENILGDYLFDKDKKLLYLLAKLDNLWEKRISIISTFYFIKNKQYKDALKISQILLGDKHDLIHKAVGWMLREIGKRDQKTLEDFLKKHLKKISRTALRYAIEHFSKAKRQSYLKK